MASRWGARILAVLLNPALLGVLLTALTVALAATSWLDGMERQLYDIRARRFQFFAQKPTDTLLHLDIDDGALQALGYWPWPRSVFARLIHAIDAAGAKVIALDVLFAERQPTDYKREGSRISAGLALIGTDVRTKVRDGFKAAPTCNYYCGQ